MVLEHVPGEAATNVRTKARGDLRAIEGYLRDEIAKGGLLPGDRLPTERQLAARFQASRSTVRKALAAFERTGAVERHVGRGTFVAAPRPPVVPLGDSWQSTSPAELMAARLLIEPPFAELFVAHATQQDVYRLHHCLAQGRAAESWEDFERWDEGLHEAIAEGTRNSLLIHLYRRVTAVRREARWGRIKAQTFTPANRRLIESEHAAIVAALQDRDQQRARKCLQDHLYSVRASLLGY